MPFHLSLSIAIAVIFIIALWLFYMQSQKKKKKARLESHFKQMQLLAENFPFGFIFRVFTDGKLDESRFNAWIKQQFAPLDNENQWQAIDNQLTEASLNTFARAKSQLYNDNRAFELQLTFVGGQRYFVRGFHLLRPYPTYIILLRPNEQTESANANHKAVNLHAQLSIYENKLNEALKQKEQMLAFYEQLLDGLSYPVWIRRSNGEVEFSNKAAQFHKITDFLETPPVKTENEQWVISEKLLTNFGGYMGFATAAVKSSTSTNVLSDNAFLQLSPALQNINLAIALFDSEGYLQWFNHRLCQMWQLNPEHLREKPNFQNFYYMLEEQQTFRLLDPKKWLMKQLGYFQEFHGIEQERLEMGDIVVQQRVVRAKQGHLAWIFEDVSDSYALQRQLRTSSDVRHRALSSLTDALMLVSSSGIIEYVNKALIDLWEIPKEFFDDRPRFAVFLQEIFPLMAIHDTQLPEDEEGWRNLLMDRQGSAGEIALPHRNLWLSFETRALPDGSQFICWQNKTAVKALDQEKELRSRALQSALERMVAFIQDVSVEVRQPTGNIQGLSELLASQKFGPLNDRQHEYAANIVSESQKLTAVVQDILDVASIDAGHLQLNIQPVNILALIHSALQLIDNRLKRKEQSINADFPSQFQPLHADELRLRQILYSLLAFASDFSRSPGSIHFRAWQNHEETSQSFFQIAFTSTAHKKLHPMLDSREHMPLEATGQLELTYRLIKLHNGDILFSYQGDKVEISLKF